MEPQGLISLRPGASSGNSPGPSLGRWQGYLPESSAALAALLARAASGNSVFSTAERALFMACEFWVAVENRDLVRHLRGAPTERLQYQAIVFGAIGAHGCTRALHAALSELFTSTGPAAGRRCLEALQVRLASTREPVDLLIAALAFRLGMSAVTLTEIPYSLQQSA